jgi:hypothetical protein
MKAKIEKKIDLQVHILQPSIVVGLMFRKRLSFKKNTRKEENGSWILDLY